MRIRVPGSGPKHASIVWIGEAPGKNEERERRPFVGATGKFVRHSMYRNQIRPEDVRFMNVLDWNPGLIKSKARASQLLSEAKARFESDLRELAQTRVLVACGTLALRALSNDWHQNITALTGAVLVNLGRSAPVVPILHPSGIMHTKLQTDRLLFDRVVARIARLATGTYTPVTQPQVERVYGGSVVKALSAPAGASRLYLDTEFDPNTYEPYMLGWRYDTSPVGVVYSTDPRAVPTVRTVLQHVARSGKITFVAHNCQAEIRSLARIGIDTMSAPWFDTMMAFATLYPDLKVGLSHVARFYLDGVEDWKQMDHSDPLYNAIDVHLMEQCEQHIVREMHESRQTELFIEEVMPAYLNCMLLELRGMRVDFARQQHLRRTTKQQARQLASEIAEAVAAYGARRQQQYRNAFNDAENKLVDFEQTAIEGLETCPVHPTYDALRKKRWASNPECLCQRLYECLTEETRNDIAHLKKLVTQARTKMKAADSKPFDPNNNNHLRWLLYDKDGLFVPKIRAKSGSSAGAADSDAVMKTLQNLAQARAYAEQYDIVDRASYERARDTAPPRERRLMMRLQSILSQRDFPYDEAARLLSQIKEYQHLLKMDSTFLQPPVDERSIAHPPYRTWGAGTGRPAGGTDADVLEDQGGTAQYGYNALNYPRECRSLFVPHSVREVGEEAGGE